MTPVFIDTPRVVNKIRRQCVCICSHMAKGDGLQEEVLGDTDNRYLVLQNNNWRMT